MYSMVVQIVLISSWSHDRSMGSPLDFILSGLCLKPGLSQCVVSLGKTLLSTKMTKWVPGALIKFVKS